jgi:hypothetical protein
MRTFNAFDNKLETKLSFLRRIRQHAQKGEIIRSRNGKFIWDPDNGGDALGCTVHSTNPLAFEQELGIPSELAYIQGAIFDRLSDQEASTWLTSFLSSINPGSDPALGWTKILYAVLADQTNGLAKLCAHDTGAQAAILTVAELCSTESEELRFDAWHNAQQQCQIASERVWQRQSRDHHSLPGIYLALQATAEVAQFGWATNIQDNKAPFEVSSGAHLAIAIATAIAAGVEATKPVVSRRRLEKALTSASAATKAHTLNALLNAKIPPDVASLFADDAAKRASRTATASVNDAIDGALTTALSQQRAVRMADIVVSSLLSTHSL